MRFGRPALGLRRRRGQYCETYLRRNRVPDHVFSEADRLMARQRDPEPCRRLPLPRLLARLADDEITPHDGLVRPTTQPAILTRAPQSASSFASSCQSAQLLGTTACDERPTAATIRSCSMRWR